MDIACLHSIGLLLLYPAGGARNSKLSGVVLIDISGKEGPNVFQFLPPFSTSGRKAVLWALSRPEASHVDSLTELFLCAFISLVVAANVPWSLDMCGLQKENTIDFLISSVIFFSSSDPRCIHSH